MRTDFSKVMMISGLLAIAFATSCRKSEVDGVVLEEEKNALSPMEMYEEEFRRLVAGSNVTVSTTRIATDSLCNEIDSQKNRDEAIRLFDQLGEMALTQPLVSSNQYHGHMYFYKRQNQLLKLWYVTLDAFCFAQSHRQESFKDWDRLFRFFKRYTSEMAAVLTEMNEPMGSDQFDDRVDYLRVIKGDLKQNVHVMRRFFYPQLVNGLTDGQKEDILRRFREIEEYVDSISPPKRKPLGKAKPKGCEGARP